MDATLPAPTRVLPARPCKRTAAYDATDFDGAPVPREDKPRVDWNYFETGGKRTRFIVAKEIEQSRKDLYQMLSLIKQGRKHKAVVLDVVPETMAFGGESGCEQGFYTVGGLIARHPANQIYHALVTETGPEEGANGRDGNTYYTPIRIEMIVTNKNHARSSAKLIVRFPVNGTMLKAYGSRTGSGIPEHLLQPDIWWDSNWMGNVRTVSVTNIANPFPLCAEVSLDPDALRFAGSIKYGKDLVVETYMMWEPEGESDPLKFLKLNTTVDATDKPVAKPVPGFELYDSFANWDDDLCPFTKLLLIPTRTTVPIIIEADHPTRRWLLPSQCTDSSVAMEQLGLPREQRCAFVLSEGHELVRDETRNVTPPDTSNSKQALVVDPQMAIFFKREGRPLFITEWNMVNKENYKQRRPATTYRILNSIRTEYFSAAEMVDSLLQYPLKRQLEVVLKPVDISYATVTIPVDLRMLASYYGLLDLEMNGTKLHGSTDVTQQREMHQRLFGAQGVKIHGPRGRVYYKLLMPSDKRGVGDIEIDLVTWELSVKVMAKRVNENGTLEGAGAIYPELVVARGKQPTDYAFDPANLKWVLKDNFEFDPQDMRKLYTNMEDENPLQAYFGMDGSEL